MVRRVVKIDETLEGSFSFSVCRSGIVWKCFPRHISFLNSVFVIPLTNFGERVRLFQP